MTSILAVVNDKLQGSHVLTLPVPNSYPPPDMKAQRLEEWRGDARRNSSDVLGPDQYGWNLAVCEARLLKPVDGAARDRARRVAGAIACDVRSSFPRDIGPFGTMSSQDAN